jgi:hypothetical protein
MLESLSISLLTVNPARDIFIHDSRYTIKHGVKAMSVSKKSERIIVHGEERTKKHVVDSGKMRYFRREKYCVKHDWVDVLAIGGDAAWNRHHDSCHITSSFGLRKRS